MRNFKRDQRGVSNVIVFVLGLVIIVIIVANVFLWNYQMNQLDWEKQQEDVKINNVARATNSSWFVTQSEYTINKGTLTSGNYTDTQIIDSNYERFGEEGAYTASPYYPSGYSLLGSTTNVSGSLADLQSNNGVYMTFRSYENTSCILQYYSSSEGESSTTSGTYSDKVILTFTPSLAGNYLIIASAGLRGSSDAYDIRVRMTIDGTTYANPTWQPDEANMWESFFTSKVINLDSSSHTIRIQYSSEDPAQTVTIRRARIMALRLFDFESNEVESEQAVTSWTYVDIVTKTFTPSTAGIYLVVATAEVKAASTSNSFYTRLLIDGVAKDEMITEGETTTDYEVFAAHNVTTLSATSHTVKIQAKRESVTMYIRRARITVVRLSDYYDYQTSGSEGVSYTSSTTWVDKTVLTFSPGTAGNYLILATAKINLEIATNGYQPAITFTIDGTEYGSWQAGLSEPTDYLTFATMINVSLSAASHTLKIRYRTTDYHYYAYIRDARIVAVRLAKQYISEVEFTGASNTYSWTQLVISVDSCWTVSYVSVYIQVYDFQNSQYPSSGQAYSAYTSSGTPNTDELQTLTITSNPTYYRNSTMGNWKIKIKGVKNTSTRFDFKADWIEFKPTAFGNYQLDLNGTFTIDLSTYPLAYIQTIEIKLRYRASSADEKWYLKAYNWTALAYSDNGFNTTAGHTPTTGWDNYAVNLTSSWQSYVNPSGTMYVKILDDGPDSNGTVMDIDFLGVRAKINGASFTFKNDGSLTAHLVSLWIINSTNHKRYDLNIFIDSAATFSYTRIDISLPSGQYTVRVVTERGNIAVYSGS